MGCDATEIRESLVVIHCPGGCSFINELAIDTQQNLLRKEIYQWTKYDASITFSEKEFINFLFEEYFSKQIEKHINNTNRDCYLKIYARPKFLFLLRMKGLKI